MNSGKKRRNNVDTTTLILVVIAAALLVVAYLRAADLPFQGIKAAGLILWRNLPLLLVSFVIAGVAQVLIPVDLISEWLGAEAGIKGVLIGSVVGGLVPGGPYISFPIVGMFYQGGASLGAVLSFVSAWSLWSVTRLPMEMALIDPKVALVRYAVTFLVPPLAGMAGLFIGRWF
jgi:uncharacterized membrane protein YraQ (UPF0718 family)